jgi:hypothetical protein
MQPQSDSVTRARFMRRLSIIVDESRSDFIRLAAIRKVQAMLPEINPIRLQNLEKLLDSVKRPWETRPYLIGGRPQMRPVKRPPQTIGDLWG